MQLYCIYNRLNPAMSTHEQSNSIEVGNFILLAPEAFESKNASDLARIHEHPFHLGI